MKNTQAFPIPAAFVPNESGVVFNQEEGMTLRDYFAAKATDDFHELPDNAQYHLVGRNPAKASSQYVPGDTGLKYMQWLAEGRARWKLMQADAMLKAREQ